MLILFFSSTLHPLRHLLSFGLSRIHIFGSVFKSSIIRRQNLSLEKEVSLYLLVKGQKIFLSPAVDDVLTCSVSNKKTPRCHCCLRILRYCGISAYSML